MSHHSLAGISVELAEPVDIIEVKIVISGIHQVQPRAILIDIVDHKPRSINGLGVDNPSDSGVCCGCLQLRGEYQVQQRWFCDPCSWRLADGGGL